MTITPTYSALDFLNRLSVNTQIGKANTLYSDTAATIKALNYIGVRHLRDCLQGQDATAGMAQFKTVADGTGAKFSLMMAPGAPQWGAWSLANAVKFASTGLVEALEGTNEPDMPYSTGNGNSIALAAEFQKQVYSAGQSLKVPVISSAYGAGWDVTGGNYSRVGNMSAYCDYGNFHAYTYGAQTADQILSAGLGWAQMATPGKKIRLTEWGNHWRGAAGDINIFPPVEQAIELMQGIFSAFLLGYDKIGLFELFDEKTLNNPLSENSFGLLFDGGDAKPSANMLHLLTDALKDAQALSTLSPLPCDVSGLKDNHGLIPLQITATKYALIVWDKNPHYNPQTGKYADLVNNSFTTKLSVPATVTRYDLLTGSSAASTLDTVYFLYSPVVYIVETAQAASAPSLERTFTLSQVRQGFENAFNNLSS